MKRPLLSICIASYNRPDQLIELLNSIDCNVNDVEIVIREDCSPKREQIRIKVKEFENNSPYTISYIENQKNLGFDGNIRALVEAACGLFVMFMGDDDLFVSKALEKIMQFLRDNREKKYILRSYLTAHPDGSVEYFRYLNATTVLPAGEKTVAWLFKRSVTICGFTISRDDANVLATNELDGTLLYQIYLMASLCLFNESIYFNEPIVHAVQSFREDKPMFGNAEAEKSRYTPGTVSHDNSINFTKAYFELTEYLDKKHGTQLTGLVANDLSKFSYPFLSIQRKRGVKSFLEYANKLEEIGLASTFYFHFYKWTLVVFGEKICDRTIRLIKRLYGHTPNF